MKKLTAYNSQNDREIGMMFSKAMCAYANMVTAQRADANDFHNMSKEVAVEKHQSEFEATVRCINMFVGESCNEICVAVIESAEEEFGI